MAFATSAELIVRYDWRWIGKQILDNNSAATEAQVLASPVIAAFLDEASEMVMAAAAVGARYSVADLTQYGGVLLVRITCDLAMGLILKRRARAAKDDEALTRAYVEALDYLEQLRRAERIFYAVPDVAEAGLPGTAPLSPLNAFSPPLSSNNCRIFGNVGISRNYGGQIGVPGPGGCGC